MNGFIQHGRVREYRQRLNASCARRNMCTMSLFIYYSVLQIRPVLLLNRATLIRRLHSRTNVIDKRRANIQVDR